MSIYQVTGRLPYRDHKHGEQFEASLETGEEERAIARGSITLIERSTPGITPGSYQLPAGWGNATSSPSGRSNPHG